MKTYFEENYISLFSIFLHITFLTFFCIINMSLFISGSDLIAWMMKSMDIDDQGINFYFFLF